MYINAASHYYPSQIQDNIYFSEKSGLSQEDIIKKTGIIERRKVDKGENTNTMGVEAVKLLIPNLSFDIHNIDLIIGATYTPFDTVGTLAHSVQKFLNINCKALNITTACSSFVNALEIIEGYFATGKSEKALIVVSENNSAYNNEDDPQSGYLWGDGAAAVTVTKNKISENDLEILDIKTEGLGNIGKGPDGVYLRPKDGGLLMPYGRDVFANACKFMSQVVIDLLEKNCIPLEKLDYLIPHQANLRIIDVVANNLKIQSDKVLLNIDKLGNTGCASAVIALSQNWELFKKNQIIVISVFGGGYSLGGVLLKK